MVVSMHLNGDDFNDARLGWLCARCEFPSQRTVRRWISRYNNDGTVHPMCAMGNRHSSREVNGIDLVNLTLFRLVRPKAYINEVRAYGHNQN